MNRANAAILALVMALTLLAGCKPIPVLAGQSPSTQAEIENDIMATRPASNVGLAPPIEVTSPTP